MSNFSENSGNLWVLLTSWIVVDACHGVRYSSECRAALQHKLYWFSCTLKGFAQCVCAASYKSVNVEFHISDTSRNANRPDYRCLEVSVGQKHTCIIYDKYTSPTSTHQLIPSRVQQLTQLFPYLGPILKILHLIYTVVNKSRFEQ